MAKTKIGILYDFDKTLCTTDMQEYSFIKNLGMTSNEFWGSAADITEKHEVEKILAYMFVMIKKCKEKGIPLTEEYLNKCGENVVLFKGVETWFDRINEYGESLGVKIEHYIISSGTYEIIEGTPIAKYFKRIYACKYMYDENGEAHVTDVVDFGLTLDERIADGYYYSGTMALVKELLAHPELLELPALMAEEE